MIITWATRQCAYIICPIALTIAIILILITIFMFFLNRHYKFESKPLLITFVFVLVSLVGVGLLIFNPVNCSDIVCGMMGCYNETDGSIIPIEHNDIFSIIAPTIVVLCVLIPFGILAARNKGENK